MESKELGFQNSQGCEQLRLWLPCSNPASPRVYSSFGLPELVTDVACKHYQQTCLTMRVRLSKFVGARTSLEKKMPAAPEPYEFELDRANLRASCYTSLGWLQLRFHQRRCPPGSTSKTAQESLWQGMRRAIVSI